MIFCTGVLDAFLVRFVTTDKTRLASRPGRQEFCQTKAMGFGHDDEGIQLLHMTRVAGDHDVVESSVFFGDLTLQTCVSMCVHVSVSVCVCVCVCVRVCVDVGVGVGCRC